MKRRGYQDGNFESQHLNSTNHAEDYEGTVGRSGKGKLKEEGGEKVEKKGDQFASCTESSHAISSKQMGEGGKKRGGEGQGMLPRPTIHTALRLFLRVEEKKWKQSGGAFLLGVTPRDRNRRL